ncbi:MAG: DNA polymerase III subunit alpha [Bacteroidia bacterium]|nr:DNA polymerase III subunit alpha [Bacteroidia bacterium]
MEFVHLHTHTEFSLLDGASKITDLVSKAERLKMSALAISDHGNMFGVPKFVLKCREKKIKPIIGSEFYLVSGKLDDKSPENKIYHQILFACNDVGYKNMIKLSSLAYTEGFYYKPRISKELLTQYSTGIIATTCCIASEINQAILNKGEQEAEKIFLGYLAIFGDNYYIELQRHGLADQDKCNAVLVKWAKKHSVKMIATNDVHYVNVQDSEAHDLLLALQTNADYDDPKRFRFTDDNQQLNPRFFFKTQQEMADLFSDYPESLTNTLEIAEKCNFNLNLNSDLLLPTYRMPEGFEDNDTYLKYLTWEGAKKRYSEITSEISERIENELQIIKNMKFAGYFLIVQSFTSEARRRGVFVGPGRGSAAGSVVAYCIGIIDIDPLQYALLFERFLNPERISPPDIDIDFDDEGRQAVIDYVIEEYGRSSVCQIITYGTMGAKTALRDAGRTLKVPLQEVNRIAKLIPDKPNVSFADALDKEQNPDTYQELKSIFGSQDPKINKMMASARTIEGTARQTGVHAAGVIIAPGEISNYVPVAINKDKVITTQFDGPSSESCGLLKMDFLGLRTLSIIKTTLLLVQQSTGKIINNDTIDLTEAKTYQLYQQGDTVATFQFESDGMRKYLRQLKPTNIEDLIAMNALYRPGPMENIPLFIDRKHGRSVIEYSHPLLEPILKNTYGIMVYQEQIMQCAQVLAQYSLGQADLLRRAMGKKKPEVMEKERINFVAGCAKNNIEKEKANDIFDTMAKFAEYGFNKSHSAAYSVLAFKTAFYKANFPCQYMAAVLTHNMNDLSKITFFIEECRRMSIAVLPPEINRSQYLFSVHGETQILFGLGAIKGIGTAVSESIIKEREEKGSFHSIYDFCSRMYGKGLNKKLLESLALAGAFDSFQIPRNCYTLDNQIDSTFIDKLLAYAAKVVQEKNSLQKSLFGDTSKSPVIAKPQPPTENPHWTLFDDLKQEREVIGFYLSAHPLDKFRVEINSFASNSIRDLESALAQQTIKIAGIVTKTVERISKSGKRYATFQFEDYTGSIDISLFGDDYIKFKNYLDINQCLLISGQMEPSFRDSDSLDFRPKQIQLLSEIGEKQTQEIILELDTSDIEENLMQNIHTLVQKNSGNKQLKFKIRDSNTGEHFNLLAARYRVNISPEFIEKLQGLNLNFYYR